jgi:hypothetical protein
VRQTSVLDIKTRMVNTFFAVEADESTAVRLPFVGRFIIAGAVWKVSTNSPEILSIFESFSHRIEDKFQAIDLTLFLSVDFALPSRDPAGRPYFRALDHLFYANFGTGDSMLVDQRERRVVGSISAATACDRDYWKRVILPCMAGITSACAGITPLHCACVAKDRFGLLIHGPSGSGKSTLALSLSMNGFSYLSDDCTYVSASLQQLRCWGSSALLKLMPDAERYFPRLDGLTPDESLNGEVAYEIDPTVAFGVLRASDCEPRWIIFLERCGQSTPTFHSVSRAEAVNRLASDLEHLPPCISEQRNRQLAVIDLLAQRNAWILRHSLRPEAIAIAISQFCTRN